MTTEEKLSLILKRYKAYLRLERGYSGNTLDAYLSDLSKLLKYFESEGINAIDATLQDLEHFSAGLADIGIHERSQARILSGVRSFYRFLEVEKEIRQSPAELLESPQIGVHLPDVLSVQDHRELKKLRLFLCPFRPGPLKE